VEPEVLIFDLSRQDVMLFGRMNMIQQFGQHMNIITPKLFLIKEALLIYEQMKFQNQFELYEDPLVRAGVRLEQVGELMIKEGNYFMNILEF